MRNRTGDPDYGKYQSILLKTLSSRWYFRKDVKWKVEVVISVHIDDIFMVRNPETLKHIKENTKKKFNISESGNVKKFLVVTM